MSESKLIVWGFVTFDMKVIDLLEGKGRFANMVGTMVCEDRYGRVRLKVNKGMKMKDRTHWWSEDGGFNDVLDKIVTIEVWCDGKGHIRDPKFKCICPDKKKAEVIE